MRGFTDGLYRWAYLLCVQTGVRSVFNRLCSRLLRGELLVSRLCGVTLRAGRLGVLEVLVHRRPRPRGGLEEATFGMISLRQQRPSVGPLLYRYLCLTSHFGCGHVEVAFYEVGGQVTIYALRDTARANAARIGWRVTARRLGSLTEEARVLRCLTRGLEQVGLSARLAPPAECVVLAVDPRLVAPRSIDRTKAVLEARYRRLQHACG